MPDFRSEVWFPHIENLANTYFKRADKRFVDFNKGGLSDIKIAYYHRLQSIKTDVFVDPTANKIDRHKILSLYTQLLLEKPLFLHRSQDSFPHPPTPWTMLINEFFCLDIISIILSSWTRGKTLDRIGIELEYKHSFLRLLYHYKIHSEYDERRYEQSEHNEYHRRKICFTYKFAHLIYFIERDFMV